MCVTVTAGDTSVSVDILIIDDTAGTPEQGVTEASTGLNLWYSRQGDGGAVAFTAVAGAHDSWTSGGIIHKDDGVYKIDVPNAAFATQPTGGTVTVGGAVDGMIVEPVVITVDPTSGTVTANVTSISGSSTGADYLEEITKSYTWGTVTSAEAATTTTFTTDMTYTTGVFDSTTNVKRYILVLDGARQGERRRISTYVSTNGKFTVDEAFGAALAVGVKVLVV